MSSLLSYCLCIKRRLNPHWREQLGSQQHKTITGSWFYSISLYRQGEPQGQGARPESRPAAGHLISALSSVCTEWNIKNMDSANMDVIQIPV